MLSDAENIAPERGLLPIRRISTLIPLRRAARYHSSDSRDGSASPALKTSTNTFQSLIPIKASEKRVDPAAMLRPVVAKGKQPVPTATNAKPTYAKLPPTLKIKSFTRLPLSPPPEEQIRQQEKSRRESVAAADRSLASSESSSGSRKRARSNDRSDGPNPKSRKIAKLHKTDRYGLDAPSREWDQYVVPLKQSDEPRGRKGRDSDSSRLSQSKGRGKSSSRRRSSPVRSRSRGSVARSRVATPVRVRIVPPPDIDSLPEPAPPSPSDDPLWLPPPEPSSTRRRFSHAQSTREISPSPLPRSSRLSRPVATNDAEQDMSMMVDDNLGGWDDDGPSAADFMVPLNFDSSRSMDGSKPTNIFASPRKATPLRERPGSPWHRSPPASSRKSQPAAEVGTYVGQQFDFAPLQDAASDDSDNEAALPQPAASLPRKPSKGPSVLSPTHEQSHYLLEVEEAASGAVSPVSVDGYAGGKTLSEKFKDLEAKLATQGRSFRLSEIAAAPSSPVLDSDIRGASIKFPDLPSSSPEKPAENDMAEESDNEAQDLVDNGSAQEVSNIPELSVQSGVNFGEPAAVDEEAVSDEETDDEELDQEQSYNHASMSQNQESYAEGMSIEQMPHSREEEARERASRATSAIAEEHLSSESVEEHQRSVHEQEMTMEGLEEEAEESFIPSIRGNDSVSLDAISVSSGEEEEEDRESQPSHAVVANLAESTYEQDTFASTSHLHHQSPPRLSPPAEIVSTAEDQESAASDEIEGEYETRREISWEDETDAEPIVQIRSLDPMAAARAAAILNMHHEYIQGTPKRSDASVRAGSSLRRPSSVMQTPMVQPRSSQVLATPSRRGGNTSQLAATPMTHADGLWRRETTAEPDVIIPNPAVVVDWTKRQWRCLEQCFTDIRMEASRSLGEDVDPEDIDLDEVVARFVQTYGVGVKLAGDWKWDKMRRRAYALVGRQREGLARGLDSVISSPTQSVFTPQHRTAYAGMPSIHAVTSREDPLGATSRLHLAQHATSTRGRSEAPSFQTPHRASSRDIPPPPLFVRERSEVPRQQATAQRTFVAPPPPSKPYQIPSATPLGPTAKRVPEPTSTSKKMWNWMGSFLRAGSEPVSEQGEPREYVPSLPPISDADREALRHVSPLPPKRKERIVPPKEQVQLQHVPTPVPVRVPKALNHKSSSGSVKDMIKSFETLSDADSLREKIVATRPFIIKKASNSSFNSTRSMDSSHDWSRDQSESGLQDISVGSVRSLAQRYAPSSSQESLSRVHVGSFRVGDGKRW